MWRKKNSLNEKQLHDTELLLSTICEHGLKLLQQQAEDGMKREGEEEEEKKTHRSRSRELERRKGEARCYSNVPKEWT